MERIAILGRSGSGKSTLADKVGKTLGKPVIHLDKIFWNPDWTQSFSERTDWINFVSKMVTEDEWIIEGNYHRSVLEPRIERATTIIFLDYPLIVCLYRALKRKFLGSKVPDRHEGMKERFGLDFLKYMIVYPNNKILNSILKYKNTKEVYIIRNKRGVENFLESLKKRGGA